MEHHPDCRCSQSREGLSLLNNNNLHQAQFRASASALGPGEMRYTYGNANQMEDTEDGTTGTTISDDREDSLDSDESLMDFSHASSMLTFHERSCCVTIATGVLTVLSYLFCLRESMGCLSRTAMVFLWFTLISLTCNMVTRYVAFTDTSHAMRSGDMRLIDKGVSSVFCSSNSISGLGVIGDDPGDLGEYFETYLLAWEPPIVPHHFLNQTLHYHSVTLAPDSYRYYQFYFLKGSVVTLAFRVLFREVTFMVIRGEESFKDFRRAPNCGYECAFYMTSKKSSDEQVRFSFAIYESNDFYFVFLDGRENWRTGSEFSVDFQFQRTRYDLTYAKSSCASRITSCSYNLEFGSSEVVLVMMPVSAQQSLSITSTCEPRSVIYVIFFVATPLSVIMLVTVVIYTTSKLCRCSSPPQTHTSDPPVLDSSSQEYDILPSFENLTVTESTPLLNPVLPSYDQAVSERLAEDMMRATHHSDPPPSYHASVQCRALQY